ncbi:hypothetical protein EEL50_12725 [Muribaculaceae bacterium Isolate-105 (HZI)]|nr:hypothetical protein EEL50_12725 [Muribaculaceae bacterium Isolate-105 (HZI)]
MNEENLKDEIKDNIAYNRSSLDCIYSTPIDEGGMEMLEQQIGEITFYEDRIEEDLEDLYILEKEDPVVLRFFGINSLDYGKNKF